MAEFDDKTKLRIIMAIAQFETIPDIVKSLKSEGWETDLRQINGYDPSKAYYEAGERWRPIFEAERKRYLEDVQAVPIANQGFRMNALQKTWESAMKAGNKMLANQTLEQAAKEVGGLMTNERRNHNTNANAAMTEEERRAMLADVIQEMMTPPSGAQVAPKTIQ